MHTSTTPRSRRPQATPGRLDPILLAAAAVYGFGSAAYAQPSTGAKAEATPLPPVEVQSDFRGSEVSGNHYSQPLLDTPRIVTVLPRDLLEEQNVTSLRDAMRNVTGISLQAGEGNPPGGDQLKIRGFNARDDLNTNGARDLGNYFRDPFYVEQIEVVKGPNSTIAGRGSAGGTVNFVTKLPEVEDFIRSELSVGTDQYRRLTLDMNRRVAEDNAVRVNLLSHSADVPGRDVVDERRYGAYAAYTWGLTSPLSFTVDYLLQRQNNVPDQGLPLDRETRNDRGAATGRLPDGINFNNFYGHLDDYARLDADQLGATLRYELSPMLTLSNQTRYSVVKNDSLFSSPRIRTQQPRDSANPGQGSLEGAFGIAEIKPRDQTDRGIYNQTDLLLSFDAAGASHNLVLGFDIAQYSFENQRRPDVNSERVDLFNPDSSNRTRPQVPYDGTVHRFETDELGVYLLNTMILSPEWQLSGGVRFDRVESRAMDFGHQQVDPARAPDIRIERTDNEVSYNLGLVYKPALNASLYAAFGSAFQIAGGFDRGIVQLAGGSTARVANESTFDNDPEETIAYELGGKWQVLSGLDLNAAVFRTDKTNARTPGIEVDRVEVLDGEQRVDGFELSAVGKIAPDWRLYAGYTFQDSEIIKSNNAFEVGQTLGGTPENTFTLFTVYDLTPKLSLGGGLLYVSDQVSNVASRSREDTIAREGRLTVSIPSYTVVDAYATYRFTPSTQLRVNAFNLGDEDYISQLAEGGSQGIPGKGRHVIATMRFDF